MKRPLTNEQKISQFFKGSPLNQAFVMEAIGRYTEHCQKNRAEMVKAMANTFVSGEAWLRCADEWEKQFGTI